MCEPPTWERRATQTLSENRRKCPFLSPPPIARAAAAAATGDKGSVPGRTPTPPSNRQRCLSEGSPTKEAFFDNPASNKRKSKRPHRRLREPPGAANQSAVLPKSVCLFPFAPCSIPSPIELTAKQQSSPFTSTSCQKSRSLGRKSDGQFLQCIYWDLRVRCERMPAVV